MVQSRRSLLLVQTLLIVIAMCLKLIYERTNGHTIQRRDFRNWPTGLRFIDRNMLLWVYLATASSLWGKAPITKVIAPLVLSHVLFLPFYALFAAFSGTKQGDFDPSGHLTCGVLVSLGWLTILQHERGLESSKIVAKTMMAYHIYSLFFTVFVFHSIFESIIGYLFTIVIYLAVYETDLFSESVTYLLQSIQPQKSDFLKYWASQQ